MRVGSSEAEISIVNGFSVFVESDRTARFSLSELQFNACHSPNTNILGDSYASISVTRSTNRRAVAIAVRALSADTCALGPVS